MMKTDKELRQILVDNLCPSPTAWVAIPDSTDIHHLSAEELERLIEIATSRMTWFLDTRTKDFVEWVVQTLQSKQFQSEEATLVVEQFEHVGMPTGITNLWGRDSVDGNDVY